MDEQKAKDAAAQQANVGMTTPYPDPNAIPFWFSHKNPPTPEQEVAYKAIHEKAREFAEFLESQLPGTSFEVSQSFGRLEECVYWAVTAVSRAK